MALFVKIVECRSISAAGRALELPKATISRRLAELERALGVELIVRTTRSLSLTDAGRSLYSRIAAVVAEAEVAATEVQSMSQEPSGLVRMTASLAVGQILLLPVVARFLERWPKVRR